MPTKTTTLRQRLLAGTAFVAMATALPAGAAFATVASVSLDFGSGVVQSQDFGSVLSQNNASPVTGTSTGTSTALNLQDNTAADVTYDGAYSSLNNSVATSGTGNLSTSAVNLAFTPGLGTDSAATGSFQTNDGTVQSTTNANSHTVTLLNADAGFENILTGTLTVDNNDISASTTVNDASASIALANGVNLDGNGAAAAVAIDETLISQDTAVTGDLLVTTAQRTTGSTTASLSGNSVNASLESLSGATVTLSNSDLTATATGNTLTGAITSTDTTASITAGRSRIAGTESAVNMSGMMKPSCSPSGTWAPPRMPTRVPNCQNPNSVSAAPR